MQEQLTWTRPSFKCQRRVRKGTWSGQGFCKRKLGTTNRFRTAAVVCLMSTSGHARDTRFDSEAVQIHVDNCAQRCITSKFAPQFCDNTEEGNRNGLMTRRAKRTKNEANRQVSARTITEPGSCVSVDQLESRTLGLIGHMKGTPTVQRYRCATTYVNHYS